MADDTTADDFEREPECECGHVADEHEVAPGGHPGECAAEIDDEPCPCPLFDRGPS